MHHTQCIDVTSAVYNGSPVYHHLFFNNLILKHKHPSADDLLCNGGPNVSRPIALSYRVPVDQTTEQTTNCHVKHSVGIKGFTRNNAVYLCWCMTRHVRASLPEAGLWLSLRQDKKWPCTIFFFVGGACRN